MPHKCHICHLLHVQISDIYDSIYALSECTGINNVTTNSGIPMFKYPAYALEQICLLHHTCVTAVLLFTYRYNITGHTNPPKKQAATLNYHAIAIYMPETNMPHKCHIYHLPHVQISDIYDSIYALSECTGINNVTTNSGIPTFTYLAYAPKQICLQHCTYVFYCTSTVVYIQTPNYFM